MFSIKGMTALYQHIATNIGRNSGVEALEYQTSLMNVEVLEYGSSIPLCDCSVAPACKVLAYSDQLPDKCVCDDPCVPVVPSLN